MATSEKPAVGDKETAGGPPPRSVQIASRGIRTAEDGANFQAALIGDIMTGDVKEKAANAACNAMGKLLKIVDMQHRYSNAPGEPPKPLILADPNDTSRAGIEAKKAKLKAELAELDARGQAV